MQISGGVGKGIYRHAWRTWRLPISIYLVERVRSRVFRKYFM